MECSQIPYFLECCNMALICPQSSKEYDILVNEVGKHLITLNWCRKIFTRLLFWTVLEFAFSYNKYYIWKNKNKEFLVHDIQNIPVLEYTAKNSSAYPEISPTLVYAFLIRNSKWMRKFLIKKILEIFLTLVYNSWGDCEIQCMRHYLPERLKIYCCYNKMTTTHRIPRNTQMAAA